MNSKSILSVLAVAILLISGCVGLLATGGGGSNGASPCNAVETTGTPIKIANGACSHTSDELLAQYGATFTISGETYILEFNGNYDVDVSVTDANPYFISLDKATTIILNGNLKLNGAGSLTKSFVGISSSGSMMIVGDGFLGLVCPVNTIANLGINSDGLLSIIGISLSITANSSTNDNSGIISKGYTLISNSIVTISGSKTTTLIDLTDGGKIQNSYVEIEMSNGDTINCGITQWSSLTFINSIVKIAIKGSGSCTGISSKSNVSFINSDLTIDISGNNTSSVLVSPTTFDRTNANLKSNNMITDKELSIESTWKDYELLDGDKKEVAQLSDFVKLKEGEIHNKKITVNFDLNNDSDDISAETCAHGETIVLPNCDETKGDLVFIGWTDGFNIYKAGATYAPSINCTLKAVYRIPGSDGQSSSVDYSMIIVLSTVMILVAIGIACVFLVNRDR